jgi:hypothetical protein
MPIAPDRSSRRILREKPPVTRCHSPIHSSVNMAWNVKRKYERVTINKPIFSGE